MTDPFTVVVGMSRTSASPDALNWARGEAAVHGGRVVAVLGWRPPRPPAAVGGKPPVVRYDADEVLADAQADLEAAVAQVVGPDTGVECRVILGGPRKALVAASAQADLVVVDFASSPRLARAMVRQARCPVAVLPPTADSGA